MNKYERTGCPKYENELLGLKCKTQEIYARKNASQGKKKVGKEVKNMENYAAKQITLRQASGIHKYCRSLTRSKYMIMKS